MALFDDEDATAIPPALPLPLAISVLELEPADWGPPPVPLKKDVEAVVDEWRNPAVPGVVVEIV